MADTQSARERNVAARQKRERATAKVAQDERERRLEAARAASSSARSAAEEAAEEAAAYRKSVARRRAEVALIARFTTGLLAGVLLAEWGYRTFNLDSSAARVLLLVLGALSGGFGGIAAHSLFEQRGSASMSFRIEPAQAERAERLALEEVRDEIRAWINASDSRNREAIEAAAQSALAATGRLAEVELAQSYEAMSYRSMVRANWLQLFGAGALVIAFALAFWLVHGLKGDPSNAQVLSRLSLSLPGAALFAYMSREASIFRRLSIWATQVAVQLQSVSAYVERLSDESKETILRELGLKVFVGSTSLAEKGGGEIATTMDPLDLFTRVLDLVKKQQA